MIIKHFHSIFLLLIIIFIPSCEKENTSNADRIIIGISADVESLNPLYAFNVVEGNITELLYLGLVQHRWNAVKSNIDTELMLAERFEWNGDSSSITLYLRDDVYWSDSVQFTSEDVIFSFDVYSDPDVQSKLYGTFTYFYLENDLSIDLEKTFEIISPFEIKINFHPEAVPDLFIIDFPLIPKHIFEKVERINFSSAEKSIIPVTNGAYKFESRDNNQSIILKANENSFLHQPSTISEIIFKVIPDYTSRITQLKNGEIDLMEDIKPDDINQLKLQKHLTVAPLEGREYEYVGWNNIDVRAFEDKVIIPNSLFGSAQTRKALTYAINRNEILEEYLSGFGELAVGPVTPIFKDGINPEVKAYEYNPTKAKEILSAEGWIDKDNNGIIEKGNQEFSFTLFIPGGNPRRAFTATLIKNNLKSVGIDVNISALELGVFIENLYTKKMDAWIASWFIPIPIDLKPYWFSDLESTPLNLISYRNNRVDEILNQLNQNLPQEKKNELFKEFQNIMHEQEPVTFLYWIDNITAFNNRIKNINVNPLGFIHHCWEWKISN